MIVPSFFNKQNITTNPHKGLCRSKHSLSCQMDWTCGSYSTAPMCPRF